jgi:hypothetical protein
MIRLRGIGHRTTAALVAALVGTAVAAHAAGSGPLHTPVGSFTDARVGKHLWTVSGAMRRLGMVTSISCTSLEAPGINADIGVEFFDDTGTQLNTVNTPAAAGACNGSVLDVVPGGSVTISNGGTAQFHEDCIAGTGTFSGSARIVSTSSKITCTALIEDAKSVILDALGNPTGRTPAVSKLSLIKRNKQAGD